MMISRKWQGRILSSIGVVVMAVLVIGANFIGYQMNRTMDLTEDQLYTLNAGSQRILKSLKTPVTLRFYFTRDLGDSPDQVAIKAYAKRVDDFLREYERAGGKMIRVERINPAVDTDEEDAALIDGIKTRQLADGNRYYFGLVVQQVDSIERIPVFSQTRENMLDYDITRLIYRVSHPDKRRIGIMSSLDMMGEGSDNPGQMLTQNRAWLSVQEMQRDYEVVSVPLTAKELPKDLDALLVVHPKDISPATEYALDQYVLGGGRLIVYLDSTCQYDVYSNPMSKVQRVPPGSSTLPNLLPAWGLRFDTERVLADNDFGTVRSGVLWMTGLTIPPDGMSADDLVTQNLRVVNLVYTGSFAGDGAEGLTVTPLIHSSRASELVLKERLMQPRGEEKVRSEFTESGVEYTLALRLTGTFHTAFPNGPPDAKVDDTSTEAIMASGDRRMESATPGNVILVGDVDWLADASWCFTQNSGYGQEQHMVFNDNNKFLQNAIEQLSGSDDLISIRSRGITRRPFTKVLEIQRAAQRKTDEQMKEARAAIETFQRELGQLQVVQKDGVQTVMLTPEQEAKVKDLQEKQLAKAKEIRELEKQQRRDVNMLETMLTLANIGIIPFLIAHFGLLLVLIRTWRQQSR